MVCSLARERKLFVILYKALKSYLSGRLKPCSVYLIFDKYLEYSIKSCTRLERASKMSWSHNLTLVTPLPARETILNSTKSKRQLIKLTSEQLLGEFTEERCTNRLIIISEDVPEETHLGIRIQKDGLVNHT